jgi:hypothetical protein
MEQNNNTFNNIKKLIDGLEYYAGDEDASSEIIMEAKYKLDEQFEKAASAEWSKSELNEYIFDNDVLDFIDVNDGAVCDKLRDDVREIQHAIINFFGNDE